MNIRTGERLRSAVCTTEVIVVKAPSEDVEVCCGGAPMAALDAGPAAVRAPDPELAEGSLLGKRYAEDDLGLELLVTKGGEGTLSVGERPLTIRGAKKLPSSD